MKKISIKNIINRLNDSILESYQAVIPIIFFVIILSIFMKLSLLDILSFILSGIFIMIGISLFTFGANLSMVTVGKKIGTSLVKSKNILKIVVVTIIIGTIITIAEPDLSMLANQLPSISKLFFVLLVSFGVGLFLMIATLKNVYRLNLNTILLISYSIVFLLLFLVPSDFLAVAFDSGGVTTGPLSVPFIVSLGLGLNALRTDKNAKKDSFGLLSLCSTGPIIVVLLIGLVYKPDSYYDIASLTSQLPLKVQYSSALVDNFLEVLLSVIPILLVSLLYIYKYKTVTKREKMKIISGIIMAMIGLTIFLIGANVGFMNMGYLIGSYFGTSKYKYFLIPIGMIIGFWIVKAEPAVKLLNGQIEDLTEGSINRKSVGLSLSLGVALAVGISFLRALTGISLLYFIIPGYILAIGLTFVVNRIFTGIAFDSGGAVSGPLTVTFLLPISIGACYVSNGNVMTDAFGLIALVSLIPLITIQLFGLIYKYKSRITKVYDDYDEKIIEYDWSGVND